MSKHDPGARAPRPLVECEEANGDGSPESATAKDRPATGGLPRSAGDVPDPVGLFRALGDALWGYANGHPHTVLYGLIGLIVSILILTIGLWGTIVIAVCVGVGAMIGQARDGNARIIGFFARMFNDRS